MEKSRKWGGALNPSYIVTATPTLTSGNYFDKTIDTTKKYILFNDLIQADGTYRAGAIYIDSGVIKSVQNIGDGYITASITGTTLHVVAPSGATAPRRIMLIQLD